MPPPKTPADSATAGDAWSTALTYIEPNRILVRGYPLDEMMGRAAVRRGDLPAAHRRAADAVDRPAGRRDARVVHRSRRDAAVDARRAQCGDDRRVASRRRRGRRARLRPLSRRRRRSPAGSCSTRGWRWRARASRWREAAHDRGRRLVDGRTRFRRRASATGTTRPIRARRGCCRSRTSSSSITSTRSSSARSSTRSRATRRSRIGRCRSTSTARSRPSAATSACRRKSPTPAHHLARARPRGARARGTGPRGADARDRPVVARLRRAVGATAARPAQVANSVTPLSSWPSAEQDVPHQDRRCTGNRNRPPVLPKRSCRSGRTGERHNRRLTENRPRRPAPHFLDRGNADNRAEQPYPPGHLRTRSDCVHRLTSEADAEASGTVRASQSARANPATFHTSNMRF